MLFHANSFWVHTRDYWLSCYFLCCVVHIFVRVFVSETPITLSMDRLPVVIGSTIFTYLRLTDFINLSAANKLWRTRHCGTSSPAGIIRSSAKSSNGASYDLSHLSSADITIWLRRLAPHMISYGITSLNMSTTRYLESDGERLLVSMSSITIIIHWFITTPHRAQVNLTHLTDHQSLVIAGYAWSW